MTNQIPEQTITTTDSSGLKVYREVVAVVNLDGSAVSGSGVSANNQIVSNTLYKVIIAWGGFVVSGTATYRSITNTTTGSTTTGWYDNSDVLQPDPPDTTYYQSLSSNGLTNAELRALPVQTSSAQLPTALGLQSIGGSLSVVVANPSSLDNEPIVTQYTATASGAGYSANDVLQKIESWNFSSSPPSLNGFAWENMTQQTVLSATPSAANVTLLSGSNLTNAQLRSSPLMMNSLVMGYVVDSASTPQIWRQITNTSTNAITYYPINSATAGVPTGAVTPYSGGSSAGTATAALQAAGNVSLSNIDTDIGTQTDAVAASDSGAFSLISLFKRSLSNWTSLLARIPSLGQSLAAGSVPVVLTAVQQSALTPASPVVSQLVIDSASTPAVWVQLRNTVTGAVTYYLPNSTTVGVPTGAVSIYSASSTSSAATNYALEAGGNLAALSAGLGADGVSPPTITGTGVRGWLRGIFEKVSGTITTAPNITRGAGVNDANTSRVTLATDSPIVLSVGGTSDTSASSDAGTWSIVALIKRSLGNWTAFFSRIPTALVSGRFSVDITESTGVPITGQSLAAGGVGLTGWLSQLARQNNFSFGSGAVDTTTQRVAFATGQTFSLSSSNLITRNTRIALSTTTPSTAVALQSTTTKFQVVAIGANVRFAVSTVSSVLAVNATASSSNPSPIQLAGASSSVYSCATGSYISAVLDAAGASSFEIIELS